MRSLMVALTLLCSLPAAAHCTELPPRIVMMWQVTGRNYEADFREIRALGGKAARTPLMAFSAFLADTHRAGDWKACFDLALPKPAGRSQLHQAIDSILR